MGMQFLVVVLKCRRYHFTVFLKVLLHLLVAHAYRVGTDVGSYEARGFMRPCPSPVKDPGGDPDNVFTWPAPAPQLCRMQDPQHLACPHVSGPGDDLSRSLPLTSCTPPWCTYYTENLLCSENAFLPHNPVFFPILFPNWRDPHSYHLSDDIPLIVQIQLRCPVLSSRGGRSSLSSHGAGADPGDGTWPSPGAGIIN